MDAVRGPCPSPDLASVLRTPTSVLLENLRFHIEEEGSSKDKEGKKTKADPAKVEEFRKGLTVSERRWSWSEAAAVTCVGNEGASLTLRNLFYHAAFDVSRPPNPSLLSRRTCPVGSWRCL